MSRLHTTVLSPEQCSIFGVLREARKRGFYLVGGTAIALHIGHRKSIDFDLFRDTSFYTETISKILIRSKKTLSSTHIYRTDNVTGTIGEVKITFFYFPFPVVATVDFEGYIKLPDLLTLAAMKAYALGRRAKWKDYVDLYFLLRDNFTIDDISQKALEIFAGNFNTKLFREQLCYFDGINYDEAVEYLIDNPPSDDEVRRFLIEKAIGK